MHYLCTYFDSNYMAKGLALYQSLARQSEPFKLWVLCLDEECFNALKKLGLPNIVPIPLGEFEAGDAQLLQAKANRSKIEYFFTSTPSLMLYVLKQAPAADRVAYLDSDLYFYAGLAPLSKAFESHSILIIEHRFSRYQKYSERHGKFNVGYVCVRRDENGMACLKWWRERCNDWCYDRVEHDRFADQKYLDRWPALFKGVLILAHKGANLAPWNLSNYQIAAENDKVSVDGEPLLFFHFQGLKKLNTNTYDTSLRDYGVELTPIIRNCIYLPYIQELEKLTGELASSGFAPAISTRYASTLRRILNLKTKVPIVSYLVLNPGTVWHLLKLVFKPASSGYISFTDNLNLCVVPLPPPITGASIASKAVVYQRGNLISGRFSLRQTLNIIKNGLKIVRFRLQGVNFNSVYMVASCTFWGHMRDIFLLMILGRELRRKTVLHLQSANKERDISVIPPRFIKYFAQKMFADIHKGIILGKAWQNMYGDYLDKTKVVEINNFFSPDLLIPEDKLAAKYRAPGKISVLYLSNMMTQKGYSYLLDAFLALPLELRDRAELHFAGHFDSAAEKESFQAKIGKSGNIVYHGAVSGEAKRDLFWKTHIFCLPTFYAYEAQPISILEAYAAGCVVVTTENGGICDVFSEGMNGVSIRDFRNQELLLQNIGAALKQTIPDFAGCERIALRNRKEAVEKYSLDIFKFKIKNALFECYENPAR